MAVTTPCVVSAIAGRGLPVTLIMPGVLVVALRVHLTVTARIDTLKQ